MLDSMFRVSSIMQEKCSSLLFSDAAGERSLRDRALEWPVVEEMSVADRGVAAKSDSQILLRRRPSSRMGT
jgi:hypothetical protein